MFGIFRKKGLRNSVELSNFIDEVSQELKNKIHNQQQLYDFVMEDSDGASQGNDIAKSYVKSLELFNVEYEGALRKNSTMDDDDSALEYLNNIVSPILIKDLGLNMAVKIRCDIVKKYIQNNKKDLENIRLSHARHMLNTAESRHISSRKTEEWIEVINYFLSYYGEKPVAKNLINIIPRKHNLGYGFYYDLYQDINEYMTNNGEIPHDIMTPLNYALRFSCAGLYAQGICTKDFFDSLKNPFEVRMALVGMMLSKEEQIEFQEDSLTQAVKWIKALYDNKVERHTTTLIFQAARNNLCFRSAVIHTVETTFIPGSLDNLNLEVIKSDLVTMFFTMGGWLPNENNDVFVHKVYNFLHQPHIAPYIYL